MPTKAVMSVKIDVTLPKDKNFPQKYFDNWFAATKRYFQTTLKATVLKEFEATVEKWQHKPSFKAVYSEPYSGARIQLVVEPFGRYTLNWMRVSEGTKNRVILPRAGNTHMTFRAGYVPHTRPGGRVFWGGSSADTGPYVRTTRVNNHSIAPRKFSREIVKDIEGDVKRDIEAIAKKTLGESASLT